MFWRLKYWWLVWQAHRAMELFRQVDAYDRCYPCTKRENHKRAFDKAIAAETRLLDHLHTGLDAAIVKGK